jgi:hypothetical protein
VFAEPSLKTGRLGGVDVPSAERLAEMHEGDYILHARDGALTRVPVEKVLLPHEDDTSPQAVHLVMAPDGVVYAILGHIICRSEDGGLTWTSHARSADVHLPVTLGDGTFIGLGSEGQDLDGRVTVHVSSDEARSWTRIAELPRPPGLGGGPIWLHRQPDGTLLAAIGHVDHVFEEIDGKLVLKSGSGAVFCYCSEDGGSTWSSPAPMHDWFSEGGAVGTASGKLLAAHRYQRPTMEGDPPDLERRMASISPGWAYKNVCLIESADQGRSWENSRLLTTVFGQTRGYPAALGDGTAVVVHDTRYGPGPPGSRAMISRDEGTTWEDEVYYLDHTVFTGSYNASVTLEEDLILTVTASSRNGRSWEGVKDDTDVYAIRWRPVS